MVEGVDASGRSANHTMNQKSTGAVSGAGSTTTTSAGLPGGTTVSSGAGAATATSVITGAGSALTANNLLSTGAGAGTAMASSGGTEHRPRLLLKTGADWDTIFSAGSTTAGAAEVASQVDSFSAIQPSGNVARGGSGPMTPLVKTKGIVFPYPPMMNFQHTTNYGRHSPTHSNFVYPYFTNHQLGSFTLQASFTIATQAEHAYFIACHHFVKTCMKMHYGENDPYAGVPPIVLEFSAYGPHIAHKIPVVIEMYNYITDPNYDYVFGGEPTDSFTEDDTALPLKMDMILQLTPAYHPKSTRKDFTWNDFAAGAILKKGYV